MPDLQNIRLPAGWYPDPSGGDHRRWWDGKDWTQHTAPFQRPAPVYDVDDLAENAARTGSIAAVPAPRRIRTAARLGRGLAALAHRLPLPQRRTDDDTDETTDAAVTGPAPVATRAPKPPRAPREEKPRTDKVRVQKPHAPKARTSRKPEIAPGPMRNGARAAAEKARAAQLALKAAAGETARAAKAARGWGRHSQQGLVPQHDSTPEQ